MNECFKQKNHVFYLIWTRLIYQTSQMDVHIEKKNKTSNIDLYIYTEISI